MSASLCGRSGRVQRRMEVAGARDVVGSLERAWRGDPGNPLHVTNLAEAYIRFGRYDGSTKQVYMSALRHRPASSSYQKALSIACLVAKAFEDIESALAKGEWKTELVTEYLDTFERLCQRHPQSADLMMMLGDLMMLSGRGYDALNRYEQAHRLGPVDGEHIGRVCLAAMRNIQFSDDIMLHASSLLEEIGAYILASKITREVVLRSTTEEYVLNLFARQLEHAVRQERDPETVTAYRIELAQVLLKLSRHDDALIHLQQFKPGAVRDGELVKQIARLLIRSRDYSGAFQHLSAIPLDDEAIALLNDIALAQEREGNFDAAVTMLQYVNTNHETMRRAREAEERDIELTAEMGIAEFQLKNERHEEAMRRFSRLLLNGYEPHEDIVRYIDRIVPKLPIAGYPSLFEVGRWCLNKGYLNQAGNYIARVMQAMPGDATVMGCMREIYDALIDRNPNIPEIRLKSAQLYHRMRQFREAVAEFEFCLNFPEVKETASHQLGVCLIESESFDKALEVYSRLRLDDDDFEPLHTLYEIFSSANEIRKALAALNLIRKRNPNYRDIQKKIAALEDRLRKAEGKFVVDPKMKELIGDLADVGRYRYIGKIGSGGMGVVHKVFDMKTNSIVAMKILREGLASSGKAIDRFYREARIAARLNHRNIVNIYDYSIGNVQGNSYITMEFVDGPSLRDLIEKKFASTIDVTIDDICEALYYTSQICDALHATHQHGIIHRDIKPDNILVNSEGVVKITDFGIVHVEEATFTPTGAMVGTPRYMSPEQVQGKKLDGRSDLYAAGIIMYELLVGSPPFVTGDVSYQHVNVEPTSPMDICPTIPPMVNDIILRCLQKAADDRFADALTMRNSVDIALSELNERRSVMNEQSGTINPGLAIDL